MALAIKNLATKGIQTVQNHGLGPLIGDALNVGFGIVDYKDAREQGDGRVKSALKAGWSFAWGELYYGGLSSTFGGPATMGIMLAPAAAEIVSANIQHTTNVNRQTYQQRGRLGSGYFNMSEAGYTMRQRSLNAIRSNGLNSRSVLGNEARTYFRNHEQ